MSRTQTPNVIKHLQATGLFQPKSSALALEGDTNGKVDKEIEYTYYAKLTSLDQLDKAASKEHHEQWEMRKPVGEAKYAGSVRVRKTTKDGSDSYVLCSKTFVKGDAGKDEVEIEITQDMFEQVKRLADSGMIKTRHFFPIDGSDRVWEIDAYPLKDSDVFSPWVKVDFEVDSASEKAPEFPLETEILYNNPFNKRTPEESAMIGKLMSEVFTRENPNPIEVEIAQEGIGRFLSKVLGIKSTPKEETRADQEEETYLHDVLDTLCNPAWLKKQTFKTGTISAPMVSKYLQVQGQLSPERVNVSLRMHISSILQTVSRYRVSTEAYNRVALDRLVRVYNEAHRGDGTDTDPDNEFRGFFEGHPSHKFAFDLGSLLGAPGKDEFGGTELKGHETAVEVPALTPEQAVKLAPVLAWALEKSASMEDIVIEKPGDIAWEKHEKMMTWLYTLADYDTPAGEVFSVKHNDEFYSDPLWDGVRMAETVASALAQWFARSIEKTNVAQEGLLGYIGNWMKGRKEAKEMRRVKMVDTLAKARKHRADILQQVEEASAKIVKSKKDVSGAVELDRIGGWFVNPQGKVPDRLVDYILNDCGNLMGLAVQVHNGLTDHGDAVIAFYDQMDVRDDSRFEATFVRKIDTVTSHFLTKVVDPSRPHYFMGETFVMSHPDLSKFCSKRGMEWVVGYFNHRKNSAILSSTGKAAAPGSPEDQTFTKEDARKLANTIRNLAGLSEAFHDSRVYKQHEAVYERQIPAYFLEASPHEAEYVPKLEKYKDAVQYLQGPAMFHEAYWYLHGGFAEHFMELMVHLTQLLRRIESKF